MKKFEQIQQKSYILKYITCDKCKRIYDPGEEKDSMEIQEFLFHEEIGGYGSVFGDGTVVRIDLCQYCFKELLGKHIRLSTDKEEENDEIQMQLVWEGTCC